MNSEVIRIGEGAINFNRGKYDSLFSVKLLCNEYVVEC